MRLQISDKWTPAEQARYLNDNLPKLVNHTVKTVYVSGGASSPSPDYGYVEGDMHITGDLDVDGNIGQLDDYQTKAAAALVAPIGSLVLWPSPIPPDGYLLADGSAVSRTEYSTLYGIVGTAYGAGDGSTTFNLPQPVLVDVET